MDSEARIVDCLRKASERVFGEEKRHHDELKDVIGLGLKEALKQLHPGAHETELVKMSEHYRHEYMETNTTYSCLFEGVETLLERLEASGYWLAIATGKGRQGLDQVLQHTGLGQRFHYTRCASETFSKPTL